MTINDACEKAIVFVGSENKKIISNARETESYYLFSITTTGEVYYSPIAVNKKTGATKVFFPMSDEKEYKSAHIVSVPNEYKKVT